MPSVSKLKMVITADGRQARDELKATGAETEALSAKVKSAGESIQGVGTKMLLIGGVLDVGIAAAATMAANFETATTALVTGAGESQAALGAVTQGLLDMAGEVGSTPTDLANGLYMIESAGYHGAEGLKVLKAVAEGAKVGLADQATVADAVTSALNAYKLKADDAVTVTNTLIATVAAGKMHMQDLAGSLGTVLPAASAAGVSLSEVGAAIATMTAQGTPAADAATYLRQTILQLQNPSKKATKALAEIGLSSREVADTLTTKGLAAALSLVQDHLNGTASVAGEAAKGMASYGTATVKVGHAVKVSAAEAQRLTNAITKQKEQLAIAQVELQKVTAAEGGNSAAVQSMRNHLDSLNRSIALHEQRLAALASKHTPAAQRQIASLNNTILNERHEIALVNQRMAEYTAAHGANSAAVMRARARVDDLNRSLALNEAKLNGTTATVGTMHTAFSGANVAAQGLSKTLSKSEKTALLADIVGGTKSMQAALELTGGNLKTFEANIKNIGGAASKSGSDIAGWALVTQTAAEKFDELKASLAVMAIEIGTAVMPSLEQLMTTVTPIVKQIADFAKAHGDLVAKVLLGAAAFFTIGGAILTFAGAITIAIATINPVTVAVLALVAVAGALATAWATNFDDIRGKTTAAFDTVRTIIQNVMAWATPYVQTALATVLGAFATLQNWVQTNLPTVEQTVMRTFGRAQQTFDEAGIVLGRLNQTFLGLSGTLTRVVDVAMGDAGDAMLALHRVATNIQPVWNKLTTIIGLASAVIELHFDPMVRRVQSALIEFQNSLAPLDPTMQKLSTMLAVVSNTLDELWNVVRPLVIPALTLLAETIGGILITAIVLGLSALAGLMDGLGAALPYAIQVARGAIDVIIGSVNLFADVITGVFKIIGDVIRGDWSGLWLDVKDLAVKVVADLIGIIKGLWAVVQGTFGGAAAFLIGMVKGFVSTVIDLFTVLSDTLVGHSIIPDMLAAITDVWGSAWNGIANTLASVWNGIVDTVRNGVDSVIGDLNGLLGAYNAIHLTIPGFSVSLPSVQVPGVGTVGGGSLSWPGFSEGVPQIPAIPLLDTGGIVSAPTIAMLAGNSRPEAVVPLNRQGGIIDYGQIGESVAAAMAKRPATNYHINANYAYQSERSLRDDVRMLQLLGAHV